MSSSIPPPYYILLSPATSGIQLHTSLFHPTIQLHYADDPPTALLPTAQNPNVFILEPHLPNPSTPTPQESNLQSSSPPAVSVSSAATIVPSNSRADLPLVHSLSGNFAVTSVKKAQPPAAAVAYAAGQGQDPSIYIIDYAPVRAPDDAYVLYNTLLFSPHAIPSQRMENSVRERSTAALLSQFHQRYKLHHYWRNFNQSPVQKHTATRRA